MGLAQIESELPALSTSEKLRLMETLWMELSRHDDLVSPTWHEQVLNDRKAAVETGQAHVVDWQAAKQQLRDRLK